MRLRRLTIFVVALAAFLPSSENQKDQGYRLPTFQEFLIVAPKTVRPNQVYEVHVTLSQCYYDSSMLLTAVLSRDGTEYASGSVPFSQIGTKVIQLKVPVSIRDGVHKLTVEGLVESAAIRPQVLANGSNVASYANYQPIFHNESLLVFSPKWVSMFFLTDRPEYVSPHPVWFRVVAVYPDLKPASGSLTVYIRDSKGNFVRRWIQRYLNFGVYEGQFDIEYPVNVGDWAIVVDAFGYRYEHTFGVRYWWQKSVEINVTVPIYMYDTEWGITGILYPEHVSGAPGWGVGNVTVKVMHRDGTLEPGEICKDLGYLYSSKSFAFSMAEIVEKWGDVSGKDLFFIGTVHDYYYLETLSGTALTHVYKDGIRLKLIGSDIRTFKPGVPFTIQVALERSDGSMYDGFYDRQVIFSVISEGTGESDHPAEDKQIIPDDNIVQYEIEPGEEDRIIQVTVQHAQASQKLTIRCYRYYSPNNRFLSITTSTEEPQTDAYMTFTVTTNFHVREINYMVVAGGAILLGSQLLMTSRQKTFALALSREMSPSARLFVYCIVQGEVVVDSLTFFVRDTKLKQPSIKLNFGKDFKRDTVEVVAQGPPGGYFYTASVDYEFLLRGALSFPTEQQVIHDLLEYNVHAQLPYFHTWWHNGPLWEESVFFNAPTVGMDTNTTAHSSGLIIMSDLNITIDQEFSSCNRSLGLGICPSSRECYELKRACDGIIDCLDGYDEVACPTPPEQRYRRRPNELDNLFWNSRFVDETFMFWVSGYIKQVGQGEAIVDQLQPDMFKLMNPMVWGAIFMHPEQGFFLASEYIQHDSSREFFVTVEYPEVIRRGEQVGLRIDVFSFWDQPLEALITLHGDDDYRFINVEDFGFAVSYDPRETAGDVQTMVSVDAGAAMYIMIPIVAKIDKGEITVRISTYNMRRYDYTECTIKVLYDGTVPRVRHTPYLVDLVNSGSLIIPDLKIPISERFFDPEARDLLYIPGSNEARIHVYGDLVSPGLFEDYLTAGNTAHAYHDSAEGYLFDFAVNLQTLNYLQTLSLLDKEKVNTALEYMQTILARQYAYMQDDGSYRQFRRSASPCTRTTSLVLRTLHGALTSQWAEIIYVSVDMLNRMALWLTSQQDPETGAWKEISGNYYDRSFFPDTTDKQGRVHTWHIPITAHVVITLSQAKRLTGSAKHSSSSAVLRASEYLASKLDQITDPFQMAITAYALQASRHSHRTTAYTLLKEMQRTSEYVYWAAEEIPRNPTERINNIEFQHERTFHPNVENAVMATSYGLLLYLENNDHQGAIPIMKWIFSQHNRLMGWSSTQDTLLALEAMTEFSYRQTNRDFYNLQLEFVCSSNASWTETVQLNRNNFADLYTFEVTPAFGQIKTRATGTGYASIAMDAFYHQEKPYKVEAEGPTFKSFYIEVDSMRFWGKNGTHMEMNICFQWLRTDLSPVSGMANVIVEIPSGYVISRDMIEWMYTAGFTALRRVQFYDQKLVTFFEYVSTNRTCFSFVADRWNPIANMSIAHLLLIQEYYETGMQMVTAYNVFTLFQYHICMVCGSFQCPYCDYYNSEPHTATYSTNCVLLCFFISYFIQRFR